MMLLWMIMNNNVTADNNNTADDNDIINDI